VFLHFLFNQCVRFFSQRVRFALNFLTPSVSCTVESFL